MSRGILIAVVMTAVYVALAVAPMLVSAVAGLPPRPFLDDFSSAIAMAGFTVLLVEFVLSGRFRTFSATMGIDRAMQMHQSLARSWTYYICGPTPIIDSVERTLDELGVPLAQIVSEKFQYDFGGRTRRNRRTVGAWLAISASLVAAAALFALR